MDIQILHPNSSEAISCEVRGATTVIAPLFRTVKGTAHVATVAVRNAKGVVVHTYELLASGADGTLRLNKDTGAVQPEFDKVPE